MTPAPTIAEPRRVAPTSASSSRPVTLSPASWHARLLRLRHLAWLCAVTAATLTVLLLEIGGWAIIGAGAAGLLVLASALLYLRPALPLRLLHHLDTGGAA